MYKYVKTIMKDKKFNPNTSTIENEKEKIYKIESAFPLKSTLTYLKCANKFYKLGKRKRNRGRANGEAYH